MDVTCVIGHFGRYQAILLLTVFVVTFPVTFTFFSTPFFDTNLDRWCTRSSFQNSPWNFGETVDDASNASGIEIFNCFESKLKLMVESNKSVNTSSEAEFLACGEYQRWESLVSQPTTLCEDPWEQSARQAALLVAVAFGYLVFGATSDVFGRRGCLLVSLLLSSVSSFTAAVAPVSWLFYTGRFLACMSTAGLLLCTVILFSEAAGRKHRSLLMFSLGAGFAVANLSFQALTLYVNNWWYLQLSSGILMLTVFPLLWFIQESPRWLITAGRLSRAEETVQRILKVNRGPQLYMEIIMLELADKVGMDFSKPQRKRRSRCGFARLRFHWLILVTSAVATLVLRQSVRSTASILEKPRTAAVWNMELSLFVQVPASLLFYWMAVRFKRRYCLACLFALLSIVYVLSFCLLQGSSKVSTTLALLVKVITSGQMVFLWLTAIELFPTTSRGLGMGCFWACAHLGLLVAPVMSMAGVSELHPRLSSIVMATVGLACTALDLFLPVTHSHILPDTYQELRQFQRTNSVVQEDDVKSSPKKLLYGARKFSSRKNTRKAYTL